MKPVGVLALAVGTLFAGPPLRLSAQMAGVGVHGVFADYREQSSSLHYSGSGGAVTGWLARGKFSADVTFTSVNYDPDSDGTAIAKFKSTQLDGRVRWFLASGVSAEVGFTKRTVDPEFEAQSVGAVRAGVHGHYLLGPGADITLRANYLAGAKFSGGGKAPFGFETGLGLSVGKTNGRFRILGQYEFQRFNRTTNNGGGTLKVPLQQSLARVGLGVGF